jgi:4-amino-4-deoxy-L-arabinose transferase-like glycosyltransferase
MVIVIFALAFGLRLAATAMFEGLHEGPSRKGFGADAVEFNAIAANLAVNHEYAIIAGHPTSFRAPGFPLLLSSVYMVAGVNNFLAARILFCLVGAALTVVIFFLTRTITNELTATVAAALTAVYPNVLYYNIHFSSEPLFTLLLTLSTWLLVCGWKRNSLRDYALSGLALGLAALTRPVAFYFSPFIVAGILWIGRRQFPRTLINATILALASVLPIVPWTIRNFRVHDRWLPFVSNGGSTFWGSNNEIVLNKLQFHGRWIPTGQMGEQKADVKQLTNEVDCDRLEWEHGKQFVREHFHDLPRLAWYKFVELWTPLCKTPNKKFNLIIGLSYGGVIPFIIWGLWLFVRAPERRPAETIILLLMPVISTVLSSLVFYGSARFRSTIEPILLIFAAISIIRVIAKLFPSVFGNIPDLSNRFRAPVISMWHFPHRRE